MKRSTKKQILSMLILFAFLGSSLTYALMSAIPTEDQVQANWAARIIIVIKNEFYPIPAGVGATDSTREKLFTVSANNIIYKTGEGDATVGDFFQIWGEGFNSTCILDFCNTNTSSMRMYVNNKENFAYDLYTIKNGDDILIDYR